MTTKEETIDVFDMSGIFVILFVGQEKYTRVRITGAVYDANGHFIYLTGPEDIIYNWSNIISMKKIGS